MNKLLFTNSYSKENEVYDWAGTNFRHKFRIHAPKKVSYGLRFIKENIPEIDILEFPTWEEFEAKLDGNGYDVVGISSYLTDTQRAIEMAKFAKERGCEVWGGNYGALTPELQEYFDKTVLGYSEHTLQKMLGMDEAPIQHPPIVREAGFKRLGIGLKAGALFTTRGCMMGCKFCQTPVFCDKIERVPLESIEKVVKQYKEMGVNFVAIADESFGTMAKHAADIVEMLVKYDMKWACMARADFLAKHMDEWKDTGFLGAAIGIESLNQDTLDAINKKMTVKEILSFIDEMKKRDLVVLGYYMIGFEHETKTSIKTDLDRLKKVKIDAAQICILTPLPQTPLWDEITERYGIFEKDWTKYDAKHLVWHHPTISVEEMEGLLDYGLRHVNSIPRTMRLLYTMMKLLVKIA